MAVRMLMVFAPLGRRDDSWPLPQAPDKLCSAICAPPGLRNNRRKPENALREGLEWRSKRPPNWPTSVSDHRCLIKCGPTPANLGDISAQHGGPHNTTYVLQNVGHSCKSDS